MARVCADATRRFRIGLDLCRAHGRGRQSYRHRMFEPGRLLADETGQTAVEYAMVVSLTAIAIAVALSSGAVSTLFDSLWSTITSAL
jgi:Flp pilus assembly pilin Flp